MKHSPKVVSKYTMGRILVDASIVGAGIILAIAVICHFTSVTSISHLRTFFIVGGLIGLVCIRILLHFNKMQLAFRLFIAFFIILGLSIFALWGVGSVSGMLVVGLSIVIAGTYLRSRHMLPVILGVDIGILVIHGVHLFSPFKPLTGADGIPHPSETLMNVVMLTIFWGAIWLFVQRSESALDRARMAEKQATVGKKHLKQQLVCEAARLRSMQKKEVRQLYRFAALGQNTAATLHDISNHLTLLSLSIEELSDMSDDSHLFEETDMSLHQISSMVRSVKRQLASYDEHESFLLSELLQKVADELNTSPLKQTTSLTFQYPETSPLCLYGSPLALQHALIILVKNALEACKDSPDAQVIVRFEETKATLRFIVTDNGPGIDQHIAKKLFTPLSSSKPTGLGAGLFIAQQSMRTQFGGTLRLASNGTPDTHKDYLQGATFSLEIPRTRIVSNNDCA